MGWNATGTWRGHYSYDPNPDLPDVPERTGFVLRLKQSWWFGWLTGEVSDDPPHGMPGLGSVEGRVRADRIEFVKRMPEFHVCHEGRSTPLAEYLAAFGHHLDESPPHAPIHYTGVYVAATDELVGTWEIRAGRMTILCEGGLLGLDLPAARGRWTATRSPG
jgi:hypothetical protein